MACNENVIKNIANEITRNCQSQGVTVDSEFVVYLIDLLLLNPKYGKLFAKTINRNNLEYFVNECVSMLNRAESSTKTLRMQFIIQTNYDKLQRLIDKHLESIDNCLRPLLTEIIEADPEPEDEHEFKKLFRKISIYIILASGLGNPGFIVTLKEGLAALDSVFSLDDLKMFVGVPLGEKVTQLNDLVEITSGVRLFNRDCKRGGEVIPDLPFNLVDAGKACLASLSNALITVMQRVNSLTTAIEDTVGIQDETGNVYVAIPTNTDLTIEDYTNVFELLAFNRQYEVFIRKLLSDVETLVGSGNQHVERVKLALEELHAAVKYKAAVPVVIVFPLFSKLWRIWRAMQNIMYLISTVNRLMATLAAIQEQMRIPYNIVEKMLKGKKIVTDQDRMTGRVSMEERLSLGSVPNYIAYSETFAQAKEKHVQFLGFCALCLCVGALVPSNMKIGLIKSKGHRYGFCSVKMALRFSKDPQRKKRKLAAEEQDENVPNLGKNKKFDPSTSSKYVNEALDYARNNPHLINLLNIVEQVYSVKNIDNLVTKHVPKTKVLDKDVQTVTHPIEEYLEKDYTWDLWEWKRRACKWASIVNCRTHSTQTAYSHMRSEVHSQTAPPRDQCVQTKRDAAANTAPRRAYLWGLRGRLGAGQLAADMSEAHAEDGQKAEALTICQWPCVEPGASSTSVGDNQDAS